MHKILKPAERTDAFYQRYLDEVPEDGQLVQHLKDILIETWELISSLEPEKHHFRYAEGKWTVKDVLVHIIDSERVFAYRALRIARGDKTNLPGFDQDLFALHTQANERLMDSILNELTAVRQASITLIESLTEDMVNRWGSANGFDISVRTVVNLIYGHHKHHMNILREKYS